MQTSALVVSSPGAPFTMQDIVLDAEDLRADEVLVEMKATGVCHTDINFSRETTIPGLFPAVLGHEGAGIVLRTGSSVTSVRPGDSVLITYNSCATCKNCTNHETSFCEDWERDNFGVGRGTDGSKTYKDAKTGEALTSHFFGQSSFSRHAVVGEQCCVKVEQKEGLETLAPLCCGIMTGAGAILNVVKPKPDSTVCVVGAGAVGLASIMALKLSKTGKATTVIAVDIVPQRLELAKKYGATHFINSKETPDLQAELMRITNGKGVDGAVDTTGRPEILNILLKAAAKRGIVVSVGVGRLDAQISSTIFDTVNSGRVYTGCCMGNCYPQEFIPMLIDEWKKGNFPFADLIKTYKSGEMQKAVSDVLDGSVIKAVLVWE